MSKYVVVDNQPNQIATLHLMSCSHLGEDPLKLTASATRIAFDDGLEALARASNAIKFGICAHCLKMYQPLLIKFRKGI